MTNIIDRRQAEQEAWERYVGDQSVSDFVDLCIDQHGSVAEGVRDYVRACMHSLDAEDNRPLFGDNDDWTFADLPALLRGYIDSTVQRS